MVSILVLLAHATGQESYLKTLELLKSYAQIETRELKAYLEKRKRILTVRGKGEELEKVQLTPKAALSYKISEDNLRELEEMVNTLKLMAYSESTINLYRNELLILMRLLGEVCITTLETKHIKSYALWLLEKRKLSETRVHTAINALKFYFEKVRLNSRMFIEIPRPKKPEQLPPVWSMEVVKRIFGTTQNLKHRTMLMLGYAAGLRISEIVSVEVKDIDSSRMSFMYDEPKERKIGW